MSVRVLIVEDEAIVAIDIAEQLTDAGFQVVGPAPSVARALKLLGDGGCDIAVLDVNLRNETVEAVACELRARGTPFLFLSAVARDSLPPGFHDEMLLAKPALPAVLVAALQDLMAPSLPPTETVLAAVTSLEATARGC